MTDLSLHQVYLWNPATRKFKILPNYPDSTNVDQYGHGLALGYFPKINDYKVIKFQSYLGVRGVRQVPTIYIYSLSTNSWKTVGNVARLSSYGELHNSVVVNGVVYWVGIRHTFVQETVCFDVENEKIREIILPPQYARDVFKVQISSINLVEHFDEVLMSAAYTYRGTNTPCILDVFSLCKGDGLDVVLTKKVTIDLQKVGRNWWPIGFRYNGELVLFNYEHSEGGFLSYDHEKDVATKILDDSWDLWSYACIRTPDNPFDVVPEHMQFMYVNSFEESLVLLGDQLST